MKKLSALLILIFPTVSFSAPLQLDVNADSAILINAETKKVLYEKNSHSLRYPASTTKIATALYALQEAEGHLDTMIVAEKDALAQVTEDAKRRSNYTLPAYWHVPGGTHMGIKIGEQLSLKTLMYGMMLVSANDAANMIAQHIGGTVPDFMRALNSYLETIGCKNTHFCNPHGLYHPKQQTTAYDLALIMIEALKNPTFKEIISTTKYSRPKTNKQEATTLVQTNRLLKKGKYYYPKAIGGKTGHLTAAGHNLVVAAKDGDRTLVAVLLKAPEREDPFKDAIALFNAAFQQPKVSRTFFKSGPQKITCQLEGGSAPLKTYLRENITLDYYPAEEPKLKCVLDWVVKNPPIVKDQKVGNLKLQDENGNILKISPLFAQEDVNSTWIWWLKNLI